MILLSPLDGFFTQGMHVVQWAILFLLQATVFSDIFFLSHNNILTTFENDYYECTLDCSHFHLLPVFHSIPFINSLIGPSLFTHLLDHLKPGEGRVLSRIRIRDSYP